jgi:hypothetical protein
MLNDACRQSIPFLPEGCRMILTDGVAALPPEQIAELLHAVGSFSEFSDDNDAHGEHDFGAFGNNGERYFWKLDYYDQWMQYGSLDPANPAVTTRVLTVLRADEY